MQVTLPEVMHCTDSIQADMDDPPALRLWWEYLECVDWRKDFYDLLVTLQSREKRYKE